ncbi:MAG: HD domain-containing protein [Firmicutes bacterium]|nr:HD domain-containing protein [Bacillota bacterium]
MILLDDIRQDHRVRVFIEKADQYLGQLGFTEHGFRHTELVARVARKIMLDLNFSTREAELAAIAGYLHDIGNVVGRGGHARAGAIIALDILQSMGMPPEEVAEVVAAIGNHDEPEGRVVNRVSAALILSDKSDVHRSRVRNPDISTYDIHDRVNYAVDESRLLINREEKIITLQLSIDQEISHVMEYFEIFLTRMVMCRRAATFLETRFNLVINGAQLL